MGAKKKSLANRLAKMSDEERARYLQHRADMDEEARRRKEQLISTFLKNKNKREDGFARLNAAKINSEWHQILRKIKCKEMKDEVEHIKRYIDRLLENKNNTIDKLMQELAESDELHTMNFQSHLVNVNKMIEFSYKSTEEMDEIYEEDRSKILDIWEDERSQYLENSLENKTYLKTITYQQENMGKHMLRDEYEYYFRKSDDIVRENKKEFDKMRRGKEAAISDLWRQISALLRSHVEHTDKRRAHLAELQTLDADSASEIIITEDNIRKQEAEISNLEKRYEHLKKDREEEIKSIKKQVEDLKKEFLFVKIQHKKDLDLDEKQLLYLTNESNGVITFLEKIYKRGEVILNLAQICRKFETQKEKVFRFKKPEVETLMMDHDFFKPDDDDGNMIINETVESCASSSNPYINGLKITYQDDMKWEEKPSFLKKLNRAINIHEAKEKCNALRSQKRSNQISIDEDALSENRESIGTKDKSLNSLHNSNSCKSSQEHSFSSVEHHDNSEENNQNNQEQKDTTQLQEINNDKCLNIQELKDVKISFSQTSQEDHEKVTSFEFDDTKQTSYKSEVESVSEKLKYQQGSVSGTYDNDWAIRSHQEGGRTEDEENTLISKSEDTFSESQDTLSDNKDLWSKTSDTVSEVEELLLDENPDQSDLIKIKNNLSKNFITKEEPIHCDDFSKRGGTPLILPRISNRFQSAKSVKKLPKHTLTLQPSVSSKSATLSKRSPTSSSTSSNMKRSEISTRSKTCSLKKRTQPKLPSSSSSPVSSQSSSIKYFENIGMVEPVWINYNKVLINCIEMKKELKQLEEENMQMKEEIRKVLELNAIEQVKSRDVVKVEDVYRKYVHREYVGHLGVIEMKMLNRMKINVV